MAKKHHQQATPKTTPAPQTQAAKPAQTGVANSMLYGILVLVCFLLYGNTLQNGFVYDDAMVITQNKYVNQGISALPQIFSTPRLSGFAHVANDSYRPLSLGMFAIEYGISGGSPGLLHFMNVALFALSVVVLFRFLRTLLGKEKMWVAWITAFLFATHPIHTEVVSNIKSRDEVLCFLLTFVAMLAYSRYSLSGKLQQLLIGSVALLGAYLSKETVITFLVVIPLTFYLYIGTERKRTHLITLSAVVVTGLYLALWRIVLSNNDALHITTIDFADNILIKAPDFATRIATSISVMGKYLYLLLIPYPLVSDYSYRSFAYTSWADVRVWLSLLAYLGMGIIGVYRLIRYKKDSPAWAMLYFLATIALFSNIAFLFSSLFGERFVYFASVGFCLAIALAIDALILQKLPNTAQPVWKNSIVMLILSTLFFFHGILTIKRNAEWSSNITLYKADLANQPDNIRLNYSLGTEYLGLAFDQRNPNRLADLATCKQYFKHAIDVYPQYQNALLSLGLAYYNFNEPDSATQYFEKAIAAKPDYAMAMFYLANIYTNKKQPEKALELLKKAVLCEPNYTMAQFNLGIAYQDKGMYDSAIVHFKDVINIQPDFNGWKTYTFIAYNYTKLNQNDSAQRYQFLSNQHNPGFKIP